MNEELYNTTQFQQTHKNTPAKHQTILKTRVRYNDIIDRQTIIEDATCELQQKIIMSDQKAVDACKIQQNSKLLDHLDDCACEIQQNVKMSDQIEDDVYELQPDGGWGWIVVLSAFLCVFMIDGVGYSFGILLPYLMTDFEALPSTTSLGGSIQSGALYFISEYISYK